MGEQRHSVGSAPEAAESVLGVFAKRPIPGAVKTRLAAATSPEWAARVADAFLRDTLDRLSVVAGHRVVAYAPARDQAFFEELAAGRFVTVPQVDGDLGIRMEAFVQAATDGGAKRVVLVGTDSPTLPVTFVEEAFARLRSVDVVLGPATDGGYYLIGCGPRIPPIFRGPAWGQRTVLAETINRISGMAWRLALLPPWYDVDTVDEWQFLEHHVKALLCAGQCPQLTVTLPLLVI